MQNSNTIKKKKKLNEVRLQTVLQDRLRKSYMGVLTIKLRSLHISAYNVALYLHLVKLNIQSELTRERLKMTEMSEKSSVGGCASMHTLYYDCVCMVG
jgi:hypothetical protein